MIQLLGLLAISWGLLYTFSKKDLSVLGLTPTFERLKYASVLFIVAAICSASAFLLKIYFAKEEYTINPSLTTGLVLKETWNQVRTVMTEELLCRGALLYLLIKKIEPRKAILFSSIIFGLLHWFNAGIWGNVNQMIFIFIFTFSMGLLLAYSYAKTFSLIIPVAIHFGWNLIQNFIFPDSQNGNHVFILDGQPPSVTVSYLSLFTMLLLPKAFVILSAYLIIRQHRQIALP